MSEFERDLSTLMRLSKLALGKIDPTATKDFDIAYKTFVDNYKPNSSPKLKFEIGDCVAIDLVGAYKRIGFLTDIQGTRGYGCWYDTHNSSVSNTYWFIDEPDARYASDEEIHMFEIATQFNAQGRE